MFMLPGISFVLFVLGIVTALCPLLIETMRTENLGYTLPFCVYA